MSENQDINQGIMVTKQENVKLSENNEIPAELVRRLTHGHPEDVLTAFDDFEYLMMQYESAIREVRTKLEILNDELSLLNDDSPISSIHSRLKKPLSIYNKLIKQQNEISLPSIVENLNDVAGIRVICSFVDDIYRIAKMLVQQDDITLIEVQDYIKSPKPNGYRSYHMIIEVPVFFSTEKKPIRVELQIRTIAMDFWASLEHQIRYKKDLPQYKQDEIAEDLKACAETIADTDMRMLAIREKMGVRRTRQD